MEHWEENLMPVPPFSQGLRWGRRYDARSVGAPRNSLEGGPIAFSVMWTEVEKERSCARGIGSLLSGPQSSA